MGMFDWVKCDYPLPGTPLVFVDEFQTKDLDCTLAQVTISEDGKLLGYNYTGELEFYGCNLVAVGPSGRYTRDGEDYESVSYLARFVDGQLQEIKQEGYERQPALSSKEMPPPGSYRKGSELNEDDSFLGQKLFVCWGGRKPDDGYSVEVVYESGEQLCVKNDEGHLELLHRYQIGNTLFKDFDEAKADHDYGQQKMQEAKDEYERKIKEKTGNVEV